MRRGEDGIHQNRAGVYQNNIPQTAVYQNNIWLTGNDGKLNTIKYMVPFVQTDSKNLA